MSNKEWSAEVVEIGEQLNKLSPSKATELLDYLDVNYGIKPPFVASVKQEEVKEKPPEQTEFAVVINSYDASKRIGLIKVYREITGLGLKEAMGAFPQGVVASETIVKQDLPKADAEKIKAQLEAAGAMVTLK